MPGARYQSFRLGDRSELLAEHLLSAFAFTTRVPRQEDIGFDFFCSLIRRDEQLLKAGPFFAVQAKSSTTPLIYSKDHEIDWIASQENPLLICVVDRAAMAMDVYSTWNVMCGPLASKPTQITLLPGVKRDAWPGIEHKADNSQEICLGNPIIRVTAEDIYDDNRVDQIATVISEWVALDRTNIVNRHAGMYWVTGPLDYETGKSPYASGQMGTAFYWNIANISKCAHNLGRITTALTLIIQDQMAEAERCQPIWKARINALREVVDSHWDLFDGSARQFLLDKGLRPED